MAVIEENVTIGVGECRLTLLPELGGKIASLCIGPHELLQSPLRPYASRTRTMAFDEGDASGWDECLPSVADCAIQTAAGQAHIPDHGDLWRVPWQTLQSTPGSVTQRANCFSLPLRLTRSIHLAETSTGWKIELLYSLENIGDHTVPWAWAAHPLFATDSGDRIALPSSIHSLLVEGSAGGTLGPSGSTLSWPAITRIDGSASDLGVAGCPNAGIGDKLFAGPFCGEAWASLERLKAGLRLTVRFDPSATPYLGLWLCYGGWPERPGLKQVCVALEPATAPVDSLAKAGPWSRSLEPGETCNWPMEVHIDRI